MFQVTTLDLERVAKSGKVEYDKDFFGKMAALTVSGQLEAETFAMAYKKVYTFGPTFRAENSNTKTHANEFWMMEPEICFCDLEQLMDIEEDFKLILSSSCFRCRELVGLDNPNKELSCGCKLCVNCIGKIVTKDLPKIILRRFKRAGIDDPFELKASKEVEQ